MPMPHFGSSLYLIAFPTLALLLIAKVLLTTVGEGGHGGRDSADELHDMHSHNTCYTTQRYAELTPSKVDLYL